MTGFKLRILIGDYARWTKNKSPSATFILCEPQSGWV